MDGITVKNPHSKKEKERKGGRKEQREGGRGKEGKEIKRRQTALIDHRNFEFHWANVAMSSARAGMVIFQMGRPGLREVK